MLCTHLCECLDALKHGVAAGVTSHYGILVDLIVIVVMLFLLLLLAMQKRLGRHKFLDYDLIQLLNLLLSHLIISLFNFEVQFDAITCFIESPLLRHVVHHFKIVLLTWRINV